MNKSRKKLPVQVSKKIKEGTYHLRVWVGDGVYIRLVIEKDAAELIMEILKQKKPIREPK